MDGEAPEAPPPAEAPDAKRLAAAAAAARRRGNPTKVGWLGRVRMIIIVSILFVYLLLYSHGNLILEKASHPTIYKRLLKHQ